MSAQPLNLPHIDGLARAKRVLIAGAGGGFDVFAGLPLYFTLREQGKTVHLANYSFTSVSLAAHLSNCITLIDELLVGARGRLKYPSPYFPEGYLAQWFQQERGEDVTVWMIEQQGVLPVKTAYQKLITHLGGVDALIVIDGGVDSIMRGDEENPGSIAQDLTSLVAVNMLDQVDVKILACLGFGTEVEEHLNHYAALENMADLSAAGAFYGACALTSHMPAFQLYEAACRYAFEQPKHARSHISTRIIPAVHGKHGNKVMYPQDAGIPVFLSPLMTLYWFYDLAAVVARSKLAPRLQDTYTAEDVRREVMRLLSNTHARPRRQIPY